ASACWLKAHLAWERRDAAALAVWLDLTVAADERPAEFWLNGARMLAHDVTAWRTPARAPAAVRRRIELAQARAACAFLERGLRWGGPAGALEVERGLILLHRGRDLAGAGRCFARAAALPGAPEHVGRIHARLQRRLAGRGTPADRDDFDLAAGNPRTGDPPP
ncbi:MAG: hypothetical protein JNG83_12260, partial [Opitutaceae bacterium]|nr:hypothetical protein [Opitutaceae bacterium]